MERTGMQKWTHFTDLDWRYLLIVVSSLSLLIFFSLSTNSISTPGFLRISSFAPLRSPLTSYQLGNSDVNLPSMSKDSPSPSPAPSANWSELDRSRIAVCLVGGARRFEVTGPSIVKRILKVYPNSDLFLNSPTDRNSYKLSLLKSAPRIAAVRIFEPKPIPETQSHVRVLTAYGSPNGIQGLLQYFNLVEGCISLIRRHETRSNFTYDWIIRTRVDGYWSAPLDRSSFIRGQYLVPPGSTYGGLNDRLGIGDWDTSIIALSRLSLIPKLDLAGFRHLNSESAFKAQLTTHHVRYRTRSQPFCVASDRKYPFPPNQYGEPMAAMSTRGPLSGVKCMPCQSPCVGPCADRVMSGLAKEWSWSDSENGTTLDLCDAHDGWVVGWERVFDRLAGTELAKGRRRVSELNVTECVQDFEVARRKAAHWETPSISEICKLGLDTK
ncbi:hypothetical protein Dimus_034481 [Dionaea muscipula]